jgi:ABC-type transporter Mla MlaB component
MANHVIGISTFINVPPIALGELRQHVLTPLIGNSLFSDAERLRANHFAHECEDVARLTRWGLSVLAEIIRRQAEAARVRRYLALRTSLGRLRATSFRSHRSRPYQPKHTWVPGACFPDRADRRVGTFDRIAAARFQSADSLTLATLLNRQSR